MSSGKVALADVRYLEQSPLTVTASKLGSDFIGIYMDPPLVPDPRASHAPPGKITLSQLVSINSHKRLKNGFVERIPVS